MQDVCVVVPLTSWQGGPLRNFVPARPRCIPPASDSDQGRSPSQSHAERIPVQSVARRLRSPLQAIDPFRKTTGLSRPLEPTRWTWRRASPPTPNHAQTAARLTTNQGSLRAPTDSPMTISSRPGREHFTAALALEPSLRPRGVSAPVEP